VDRRREVPSVERVLRRLDDDLPHALRARCAREAVDQVRTAIATGATDGADLDAVVADARARARTLHRRLLAPLVNGTGVLLHTNLGRAPLGTDALAAVARTAAYSNLEYDTE
jgi:L-seryl-tRNA(Ser) seleniumtransferase